jgi:hypothetical protein
MNIGSHDVAKKNDVLTVTIVDRKARTRNGRKDLTFLNTSVAIHKYKPRLQDKYL